MVVGWGGQTAKIGSLVDIEDSEDPEGLRVFYYLIQDLRVSFFFTIHAILEKVCFFTDRFVRNSV